jgi:hypothetical protein
MHPTASRTGMVPWGRRSGMAKFSRPRARFLASRRGCGPNSFSTVGDGIEVPLRVESSRNRMNGSG